MQGSDEHARPCAFPRETPNSEPCEYYPVFGYLSWGDGDGSEREVT